MNSVDPAAVDHLIALALAEDAADVDLTAQATIAADQMGHAVISAKAAGVLSGIAVAERVFDRVDTGIEQHWQKQDGDSVTAGDVIARLAGSLRALLSAERTALNFIQHLSGIASATQSFVKAVEGTDCTIVDTRKTTPGLRYLEKQAVCHGGGANHRMDLHEGMLIKENHIAGAGSISAAIAACRSLQHELRAQNRAGAAWVELECESMDELREAVAADPDIILLDNMDPEQTRRARKIVPASIVLESSGNITLGNARAYADAGVDRIAIGAITHSTIALDISMRVQTEGADAPDA